jgi:hypothetical protein
MQHARPNRLRRAVAYAALAVLLGVVSLTLAQCTMVGDSLTGVDLVRGGATTCLKLCNDKYALFFKIEQKSHNSNLEQCNLLSGQEQQDCKAAESARHEAAKAQLTADKIACQDNCHKQGTGSAG